MGTEPPEAVPEQAHGVARPFEDLAEVFGGVAAIPSATADRAGGVLPAEVVTQYPETIRVADGRGHRRRSHEPDPRCRQGDGRSDADLVAGAGQGANPMIPKLGALECGLVIRRRQEPTLIHAVVDEETEPVSYDARPAGAGREV
ncbi:hypothetical protein GCM10010151_68820 [Actinoallomurus spadix]|uniref:Uncharacterized protein n=1 Tax=Actinoallomurus spadix TaxID=79912 RepID=A0ABN0XP76_9ACTN